MIDGVWILSFALIGQSVPAPPAPGSPPAIQKPSDLPQEPQSTAPKTETARYVYDGKPIKLSAICGGAEIHEFGLLCTTDEPCPVYLELDDVAATSTRLFVGGNFHTDTATLWSILLASEDNGLTWFEVHERLRAASLTELRFSGDAAGWAAGHVVQNFPRNPFLLRTTNSGKTWTRITLPGEDPNIAVVESMWFSSPADGAVVLDRTRGGDPSRRYQKLETTTGGDTWTTREVAQKPILLPKLKVTAEWRLRPDAGLKAYRLERRMGQRWQTMASFALGAGDCQPDVEKAEPAPAPPPVPQPPPDPPLS